MSFRIKKDLLFLKKKKKIKLKITENTKYVTTNLHLII